jgi:hypothetical protein
MALETRILVKAAWTLADRCGGLESGLGARSPVKDLRDATPDGLRRSAFREGFAVRTRVSGAVDLKAVGRKPNTVYVVITIDCLKVCVGFGR